MHRSLINFLIGSSILFFPGGRCVAQEATVTSNEPHNTLTPGYCEYPDIDTGSDESNRLCDDATLKESQDVVGPDVAEITESRSMDQNDPDIAHDDFNEGDSYKNGEETTDVDEDEDDEDDDEEEVNEEAIYKEDNSGANPIWYIDHKLVEEIWEEGDLGRYAAAVGCPDASSDGVDDPETFSNIPTAASTWNVLYEAYHAVVPTGMATIPLDGYRNDSFPVPVEIKAIPYKGRGIFAKSFIPKGNLVWEPRNVAGFPSRKHYQEFHLYLLEKVRESLNSHDVANPISKNVICDALMWLWTAKAGFAAEGDEEGGYSFMLCTDFSEGSMINSYSVGHNTPNLKEDTTDIGKMGISGEIFGCHEFSLSAIRDIYPGEEILQDYGSAPKGSWDYLNLSAVW